MELSVPLMGTVEGESPGEVGTALNLGQPCIPEASGYSSRTSVTAEVGQASLGIDNQTRFTPSGYHDVGQPGVHESSGYSSRTSVTGEVGEATQVIASMSRDAPSGYHDVGQAGVHESSGYSSRTSVTASSSGASSRHYGTGWHTVIPASDGQSGNHGTRWPTAIFGHPNPLHEIVLTRSPVTQNEPTNEMGATAAVVITENLTDNAGGMVGSLGSFDFTTHFIDQQVTVEDEEAVQTNSYTCEEENIHPEICVDLYLQIELRGAVRRPEQIELRAALKRPATDPYTVFNSSRGRPRRPERQRCKTCFQLDVATQSFTCGHMANCSRCAPVMRRCSICMETISFYILI